MTFGGHQLLRSGRLPDPGSIVIHYAHRPFRSVIDWKGSAYGNGLLRRLPSFTLFLAGRPALLELLLERAKRLPPIPVDHKPNGHILLDRGYEDNECFERLPREE